MGVQEKIEKEPAGSSQVVVHRRDLHAFHDGGAAGGFELLLAGDAHNAKTAVFEGMEQGTVTKGGDVDAHLACRLENGASGGYFYRPAVHTNPDFIVHETLQSVSTSSKAGRHRALAEMDHD
jgi:hypothetical protein